VNALISAPITADLLRGALELETTAVGVLPHRLPARARALADAQLLAAEACPAGSGWYSGRRPLLSRSTTSARPWRSATCRPAPTAATTSWSTACSPAGSARAAGGPW
jgi:hypothetical protein